MIFKGVRDSQAVDEAENKDEKQAGPSRGVFVFLAEDILDTHENEAGGDNGFCEFTPHGVDPQKREG